jgi:hypothetical protein
MVTFKVLLKGEGSSSWATKQWKLSKGKIYEMEGIELLMNICIG